MTAYRVPIYPLTADGEAGEAVTVTEYAWSPWQARANLTGRLAGRGYAIGYAEAAR